MQNPKRSLWDHFEIISKKGILYFKQESVMFGTIYEPFVQHHQYFIMHSNKNRVSIRFQGLNTNQIKFELKFHEEAFWGESQIATREVIILHFILIFLQ
jgi:hypothetical protein